MIIRIISRPTFLIKSLVFLLSFFSLQCSSNSQINFSTTFYVDRNASGNGDGSSWQNAAKSPSDLNWSNIHGGDSVYISGGIDSTVYTSRLEPGNSGTPNNKIIITKGKDAGHSGKVIFNPGGSNYALYSEGHSYIEYSYMTFENGAINGSVIGITHSDGVDILHCTIYHPTSHGMVYEYSNDGRFLYNKMYTGPIHLATANDGIGLTGSGNIEIGYNVFIENNANPASHLDVIQGMDLFGQGGGINKIHHNFFLEIPDSVNSCLDLENVQGTWEVYNNIIVCRDNKTYSRDIEFWNQADTSKPLNVKIFNNTIIGGTHTYSIEAFSTDSLEIINNVFYKPTGIIGVTIGGNANRGSINIDYNEYYLSSSMANQGRDINAAGGDTYYNWAQWQSLGYDIHSYSGVINLVNASGTIANDFQLVRNGKGVDAGKTLTLFSDDYNGVKRPQGSGWDIGAFEQK
jgi:hypothetical protein